MIAIPLFIWLTLQTQPNFHLRAGSPAIGKALCLSQVTTDADGKPRPQPGRALGSECDMGAFQFSNTAPPVTSPDKTRVPPASQIIDASGNVWTLAADKKVLINGDWSNGGFASVITWCSGNVRVLGEGDNKSLWWSWNGTTWLPEGTVDLCVGTPTGDVAPPTVGPIVIK